MRITHCSAQLGGVITLTWPCHASLKLNLAARIFAATNLVYKKMFNGFLLSHFTLA